MCREGGLTRMREETAAFGHRRKRTTVNRQPTAKCKAARAGSVGLHLQEARRPADSVRRSVHVAQRFMLSAQGPRGHGYGIRMGSQTPLEGFT